jgi:hypothetical protein
MGNIPATPTKKLSMLVTETNDFSVSITNNVIAEATQQIISSQTQNILIENVNLTNCPLTIRQEAEIIAKQEAAFKVFLSNPKKVLKTLTEGPNSLFGQAFASNSSIMKDFLDSAKQSFNAVDDSDLRMKLTNIIKVNISQSSISRASQKVLSVQSQNISLSNVTCTGTDEKSQSQSQSKIDIVQKAKIEAYQQVLVQIVSDVLSSNPNFRRAVREFNGDYNKGLLDEQIDPGTILPSSCPTDLLPPTRLEDCPGCEDCPICPIPPPCDTTIPQYGDFILSAKLFYIIIGVVTALLLLSILLKK